MINRSSNASWRDTEADRRFPPVTGGCGKGLEEAASTVLAMMPQRPFWMILPDEVPSIEQQACCGLIPAFEESDTDTASDWVLRCKLDLAQLWRCGELWAVTQVVRGKRGLVLQIIGMAGSYDPALLKAIESWGRGIGCVRACFTGRKGWLRREPEYRMATVTGFKEL